MCRIIDWVMFALLGCCGFTDLKRKTIPLFLLIAMSVVVGVSVIFCNTERIWLRVGGLGLGILFLLVSRVTKEAVGYGDSWLILLLGAYLGIEEVLPLLFTATLGAAVVSLFYLWIRRWKRSATLPFVPFLVIAYLGRMFV